MSSAINWCATDDLLASLVRDIAGTHACSGWLPAAALTSGSPSTTLARSV